MSKKWKFKIENDVYEWGTHLITGAEVRAVGPGIPESMDLFLKVAGAPGTLVEASQQIDLDAKGIEKFYSQEADSEAGIG